MGNAGDRPRIERLVGAVCAHPRLALGLWAVALLALHSPHQSFMAHDEGYYAAQARMILATGDWLTQQWWGIPVYDRAQGIVWLIAASQWLLGLSEFASRLPSAMAGFAAVFLTYAIGRRVMPAGTALLGAAILAVTPVWMQASRLAAQDVPLVAVELFGIWALLRAEEGQHRRWCFLAGAAFGLGFALKSFMVFPAAAALLPYLIWHHRRHRHLANPALWLGMIAGLAPTAVWLGLSVQLYGTWVLGSFFGKLVSLAREDFHHAGPLYYLWVLPLVGFPWTIFAVFGAVSARRDPGIGRKALLVGFPLVLLVELSAFTTRTWYYGLQILPFATLLAAVALRGLASGLGARRLFWPRFLSVVLAALGVLLLIAAAVLVVRPDLASPGPAWRYSLLGLAAGIGFLAPVAVLTADTRTASTSPAAWMAAWLVGPWLAIAALFATGLWGDYAPGVAGEQAATDAVVARHADPVYFVKPAAPDPRLHKQGILLVFRAPKPGPTVLSVADLPGGAVAWVPDDRLGELPGGVQVLASAGVWQLVALPR